MISNLTSRHLGFLCGGFLLAATGAAQAQNAYGYSALAGDLYSVNLATASLSASIGTINFAGENFVPEGIDFNPFNGLLYALDVNGGDSFLYTLDLNTAAATLVGSFPTFGIVGGNNYNLYNGEAASAFKLGFDFNPKTLQPNNSLFIRIVSEFGDNLRIRSDTGALQAVDTDLTGASFGAVGAGYSNNVAASSGGTNLYYVDDENSNLLVNSGSPNLGVIAVAGPLGFTPLDTYGLDVFTNGIGLNTGYLVNEVDGVAGSELYRIDNIGVVAPTAVLVGNFGGVEIRDVAVQPVPEPGTLALLALGFTGFFLRRR